MSCERYENMISPYIEDDLSAEEKADFELHIGLCDSCRQQLAALRCMQDMLRQEDKPVKAVNIRGRIYSRLIRDFLIMFAGLVIIVSVVSISGGLAQILLTNQLSSGTRIFFFLGIFLLIAGLIILTYDVFMDMYRLIRKR